VTKKKVHYDSVHGSKIFRHRAETSHRKALLKGKTSSEKRRKIEIIRKRILGGKTQIRGKRIRTRKSIQKSRGWQKDFIAVFTKRDFAKGSREKNATQKKKGGGGEEIGRLLSWRVMTDGTRVPRNRKKRAKAIFFSAMGGGNFDKSWRGISQGRGKNY